MTTRKERTAWHFGLRTVKEGALQRQDDNEVIGMEPPGNGDNDNQRMQKTTSQPLLSWLLSANFFCCFHTCSRTNQHLATAGALQGSRKQQVQSTILATSKNRAASQIKPNLPGPK